MSAIEGWGVKRFDEFSTIFSGSTPSTTIRSFWDGNVVWVTPTDLSRLNTPYLFNSVKRITEKGLSACSATLLPPKSLVMSSRAPIGYVALPAVPFCTNQGCKTMKLKSGYDPEFTYYNVLFNIEKVKGLGEGTTFAEISKKALSTVEIQFPESLPEQAKIAEVLSTVDRGIAQTEALIAKQQRIKTGLMADLLTRGIDEHGNLRSEATHAFQDSPLGRIPVEWEVVSLQSMASRRKYAFVDGPFGSNLKSIHYRQSGVPIIQSGFVTSGRFMASKYIYVEDSKFRSEIRSKVIPGDIVMAKIGANCGTCAILPSDHPIGIIAGNCIKITISSRNSTQYVLASLQREYTRTKFEDYISTTAQPAVNMPVLKIMQLSRPPLDEQRRIVTCLESLSFKIKKYRQMEKKLRSLKTALMQDLLTGEVRVTDLLDTEVAG